MLECADDSLELLVLGNADLPLGVSISMSMSFSLWIFGVLKVFRTIGNNVFTNSLLGATIQDGGMSERSVFFGIGCIF